MVRFCFTNCCASVLENPRGNRERAWFDDLLCIRTWESVQQTVWGKREIAWFDDLLCIRTWESTSHAGHGSPSLAGTLWPEGSKGLSRFPHWFRHQTHQGRVWIPRWVDSTQKSRRHEKTWDAQNEEKTKFPTSIVFFCLACCFVFYYRIFIFSFFVLFCFFTAQVGMVWSIVGLHSWVWLEACFEKPGQI